MQSSKKEVIIVACIESHLLVAYVSDPHSLEDETIERINNHILKCAECDREIGTLNTVLLEISRRKQRAQWAREHQRLKTEHENWLRKKEQYERGVISILDYE